MSKIPPILKLCRYSVRRNTIKDRQGGPENVLASGMSQGMYQIENPFWSSFSFALGANDFIELRREDIDPIPNSGSEMYSNCTLGLNPHIDQQ